MVDADRLLRGLPRLARDQEARGVIPNVTRGGRARGLLRYLTRPEQAVKPGEDQRVELHANPRLVARQRAADGGVGGL